MSDAHKGARFVTADIKNHYLQSPMSNCQYMKIPLKYFTQEIREKDDIMNLVDNGYVHIETKKGMHGIKETGILAFNYAVESLASHGYRPVKCTAVVWIHETRNTKCYYVCMILVSNMITKMILTTF